MSYLGAILIILAVTLVNQVEGKSLVDIFKQRSELKEFLKSVPVNDPHYIRADMESRQMAIFAPTNRAMKEWQKKQKEKGRDYKKLWEEIYIYHVAAFAVTTDAMKTSIATKYQGSYPIWVSKTKDPKNGRDVIYLNNAKIITPNLRGGIRRGASKQMVHQVLHIIDTVLEPVTLSSTPNQVQSYNPTAYKLIKDYQLYKDVELQSIKNVVNRKKETRKGLFDSAGRNTYFLPTGKDVTQFTEKKIDDAVLEGSVVKGNAWFTSSFPNNPYEVNIQNSPVKVRVQIVKGTNENGDEIHYARSTTYAGDSNHPVGTVLALITRGNIPVSNGVVHFIDQPLMVIDTRLKVLLQRDPNLSKFHKLLQDKAKDTFRMLRDIQAGTILAPSNKAFDIVDKRRYNKIFGREGPESRRIGSLHVVDKKISRDVVSGEEKLEMFQAKTASKEKYTVYFHASGPVNNRTLSVDAAGVNATVLIPDIAGTNGYIHVIDRILGIPYQSVFMKLSSDPMLKKTFFLGQKEGFNTRFRDKNQEFTYFVPSNMAWQTTRNRYPSSLKKIFMHHGSYAYHANQILDRHLMVGEGLTLDELVKMSKTNKNNKLQMARGQIGVVKVANGSYVVRWNGIDAIISRPNIECTDGYIHVIDRVLMTQHDVTVSSAVSQYGFLSLGSLVAWMIFTRVIAHYDL